jgi:NitT/TauT family transport system substrate-binding protein
MRRSRDAVSLRLKWFHQAQFAGYYLAQDNGFYAEEGLDVTIEPGGPDVDPEQLVGAGATDFAQAGGMESVIAARDKGLLVVAIGAVFQRIDVVFIAKQAAGIKTLGDMLGKSVSTWYTGAELILRGLLRQAGLDPTRIVERVQGGSMQPFLLGEVSVAAATLFNQLPMLREQGITDLTIFDPLDYGVVFPRDAIITSEAMIAERPEIVRHFLQASMRGWSVAVHDQALAIDAVLRRNPKLDRHHQSVMMREVIKLMLWQRGTTHGLGNVDPAAVEAAGKFLYETGQIKHRPEPARSYTARFWEPPE